MVQTQTKGWALRSASPALTGMLFGLLVLSAGCPDGAHVTDAGFMRVALSSDNTDVFGFWVRVYDDTDALVAERYAPLSEGPLPSGLSGGASEDHPVGDAYFVLPAGTYTVRATPMQNPTEPSRDCEEAEATGVLVVESMTTEILLVAQCGRDNGGLDVIVTTNHSPLITDLDFLPSKFVATCEPLVIKVEVEDAENDPFEISWEMVMTPPGAEYETDTSPDGRTWFVLAATPGTYQGRVTACETFDMGTCSALSFPIHVTGEAFPSVERCLAVPQPGTVGLVTAADVRLAEEGTGSPPGDAYPLLFSEGDEAPQALLSSWRWFLSELDSISADNPDAQSLSPEEFGETYEEDYRFWLDSMPGIDAEVAMTGGVGAVITTPMPEPPEPIIDDDLDPCDKPSRGFLPTPHCSGTELNIALESLTHAHYQVWRMRQMINMILAQDDATATELWGYGGDPDDWEFEEENWQLHNWFGRFNRGRAEDIRGALNDIWNKYLGPGDHGDFRLQCYPRPSGGQRALWVLTGQWWKFANPCYWNEFHSGTTPAHHWNRNGPELCNRFFEADYANLGDGGMRFRGAVLVHEFLHRTWIDSKLVKDTHYSVGCDWTDGAQKCYSEDDSMGLADNHPDVARLNNSNYEHFGRELAEQYLEGDCTDPEICAERDATVAACNPPTPTFPNCDDPDDPLTFGTPGCPCRDIDIFVSTDVTEDGGSADGAGSHLANGLNGIGQFCEGPDVVCAVAQNQGLMFPRCATCGDGSNIGCPCDSDADCAGEEADLVCWGLEIDGWGPSDGGTCYPSSGSPSGREALEEMPWFCLDNCDAIDAFDDGQVGCVFNQLPPLNFPHGECLDFLSSCPGQVGECEESGLSCNFDDECEEECASHQDCTDQGFPDFYLCDALGDVEFTPAHCVPPECVNQSSSYCNLFR